jgi:protein SCO1
MRTPQKILATILWGMAVFGMFLLIALSNAKSKKAEAEQPILASAVISPATQPLFELPAFKLVDQDGKEFTDKELRGKPFVASFVFTHCAGPCPMMFGKMAAMQKSVTNANVRLVTFTVDPERDTPEVLKKKATDLGAEPGRWVFLTGDKDAIHKLLREGMHMATPKPEDDPLMHTTAFYLFDANGSCRARYFSGRDDEMERLAKDADALAEGKPL